MLKIFVCEDNEEQRLKFEKMISNIIMIENYDITLRIYSSTSERISGPSSVTRTVFS